MNEGRYNVFTDKENMHFAKQEYVGNPYLGMSLEKTDKTHAATLSDINDNRTNNGEQNSFIINCHNSRVCME